MRIPRAPFSVEYVWYATSTPTSSALQNTIGSIGNSMEMVTNVHEIKGGGDTAIHGLQAHEPGAGHCMDLYPSNRHSSATHRHTTSMMHNYSQRDWPDREPELFERRVQLLRPHTRLDERESLAHEGAQAPVHVEARHVLHHDHCTCVCVDK